MMIERLEINNFSKCNNIWDMQKQDKLAMQFYDDLKSGNRITYVYQKDNVYLAEASIVFDMNDKDYTIPSKRVYLSRVITKKEYCNRGIATLLIEHIINVCETMGYKEITVGVDVKNNVANHLYKKLGFNEVIYHGVDQYGEYCKLLKRLIKQ